MSVYSMYTKADLREMDIAKYIRESTFDNIMHPCRLLKVARYARESTNHEDQKKALDSQIERLDSMISGNPYYIMEEKHKYTERGVSGRTTVDRVAFNIMMEAASRGEFNIIIVQDICRFARNLRELLNNIEVLKEYGVGVLVLDGAYWTYNMSDIDILRLAIDGGMAQGESMRTAKRVNNGVESYRKRGQLVVSGLFGYKYIRKVDKQENTLEVDPVSGLTVMKIFELYTHPEMKKRMGSQRIANYLNEHGYVGYDGNLTWTPPKVNRVLQNEKYMGYILYGKFKITDTMTKKKVATKIKPIREDILDEEGNVIQQCNLAKGDWEPLVSEEVWWLAHEIRNGRAAEYIYSRKGNIVCGLRESIDVIANKSFCQCGYSLSPQYVHVAQGDKRAQLRYKCRHQVNSKSTAYQVTHKRVLTENQCEISAVSEVKMWLMSLKVFEYIFDDDGKKAILDTLKILEISRKESAVNSFGVSLGDAKIELEKVTKQIDNLYLDKLAEKIDENTYKRLSLNLSEQKDALERRVAEGEKKTAQDNKELFNISEISKRLDTYIDFTGYKVSDEMLDLFVERIIARDDEFVWEMNLSGVRSDARKYRISEYSKEHADELRSDESFKIIHSFLIPLTECEKFVRSEKVGRRFVPRYWRPIVVKIAVK